jgi:hypothetical protein
MPVVLRLHVQLLKVRVGSIESMTQALSYA